MIDRSIAPAFREIKDFYIQQAETILLDNGVPLHFVRAGSQPVIRIEIILRSGGSLENSKGVASFTTKMLSEGTDTKSAEDISKGFDKFGAFLELESGMDYNYIILYALTKHLPSIVPLLHEVVFRSTFPEKELEVQKNIYLQELRVNLEKNSYIAGQKFRKALFGDYSYGKELGEDEISSIQPTDLKNYYSTSFFNHPELLLAGDVSNEVIELINNYFGRAPFGIRNLNFKKPSSFPSPQRVIIEKEKSLQSSIRIGKLFPGKNHPDFIKLLFLNEIFGGYFGSRLMKNIREAKGYTYGIHSRIINYKNASYIIIATDVKKEFTIDTIREVKNEIEILQTQLVSEDEVSTVKSFMLGSFLSSINTPFSLADKFKSVHFFELGYEYYKNYIETINSIDAQTIKELAIKYLDPASLTEVIVGGE